MTKRNNVDLEALEKTLAEFQSDPAKMRRTNRVEGIWNVHEGEPQFVAEVGHDGRRTRLEADQPLFLGGSATRPGPIQYCLYGLASCYTATFATMAAMEGVELEEVRTAIEADMNFARVFGLSDEPITSEIRINLTVRSSAPQERLEQINRLAEQRCPAVYCLTNPIRLVPSVTKV